MLGLNDDLVNIYLHCVEEKAYNFYVTLGFKRINGKFDDGFQELPIALQNSNKVGGRKVQQLCFITLTVLMRTSKALMPCP